MQTVGRSLTKRASMHPHRIALYVPDGRNVYVPLTYRQLHDRARRLHDVLLAAGYARGDRIAILSYNCPQFVELLFAAALAGMIVVPLNVRLSLAEWRHQLQDSGARLLVLGPEFVRWSEDLLHTTVLERTVQLADDPLVEVGACFDELASQLEGEANANRPAARATAATLPVAAPATLIEPDTPIALDDPFIICYTSGTTGAPKGAVLTHGNQLANALNACMTLDIRSDDTTITLLPMFHTGGIGLFTLPTLYAGGTVVLPRQFDPDETLSLIESFGVTTVFAVPTIHQALIDAPAFADTDLSSVRWFYSGGAPCPHDLIEKFHNYGLRFGQGYGLTETSPTHFLLVPEDFERKLGTVGRPALHAEARIVDEAGNELPPDEVGEIVVAGPNVFKQYWGRPDETATSFKDGWFYTGDLGRADAEGFVTIVGRRKELIISGGENIYPIEVEQVLESHPDITEAAVVGLPDPRWGETPHAALIVRASATVDPGELSIWGRERLAGYKVPKSFHIVAELPRNAAGKVLKSQLIVMLTQRQLQDRERHSQDAG